MKPLDQLKFFVQGTSPRWTKQDDDDDDDECSIAIDELCFRQHLEVSIPLLPARRRLFSHPILSHVVFSRPACFSTRGNSDLPTRPLLAEASQSVYPDRAIGVPKRVEPAKVPMKDRFMASGVYFFFEGGG